MHHDYLFILTHTAAAIGPLMRGMNAHSEININRTPLIYTSPLELYSLRALCESHKECRVYGDIITQNHALRSKSIMNECLFVIFLHDPRRTITSLIKEHGYSAKKAIDHYSFRLQRLALLAKEIPSAQLITWEDLESDQKANALSDYLNLKNNLRFSIEREDLKHAPIDGAIAEHIQKVYNKYLLKIQDTLGTKDVRIIPENTEALGSFSINVETEKR